MSGENPASIDQAHWPRSIAVSLSGGGYRAALFSLGALLYLVDRGLNGRTRTIMSVSGSSITNAFVASQCDFRCDGRNFDDVARELVERIRKPRIRVSITVFYLAAMLGALAIAVVVTGGLEPIDGLEWVVVLFVWALFVGIVIARGWFLEYWLDQKFFEKCKLGDIENREAKPYHVFCATNLTHGVPFFFTNVGQEALKDLELGYCDDKKVKLARAVRASAAYPVGLPAKYLRADPEHTFPGPRSREDEDGQSGVWLCDGGVWNNLGTDWLSWLRSGTPSGAPTQSAADLKEHDLHLVVNASLPSQTKILRWLWVPGVGEVSEAVRAFKVSYQSTLTGRLTALARTARSARQPTSVTSPTEPRNGVADIGQSPGAICDQWDRWLAPKQMTQRAKEDGAADLAVEDHEIDCTEELAVEDDSLPGRVGKYRYEMDCVWKDYKEYWESCSGYGMSADKPPNWTQIHSVTTDVRTGFRPPKKRQALLLLLHGYLAAREALYVEAGVCRADLRPADRFCELVD